MQQICQHIGSQRVHTIFSIPNALDMQTLNASTIMCVQVLASDYLTVRQYRTLRLCVYIFCLSSGARQTSLSLMLELCTSAWNGMAQQANADETSDGQDSTNGTRTRAIGCMTNNFLLWRKQTTSSKLKRHRSMHSNPTRPHKSY